MAPAKQVSSSLRSLAHAGIADGAVRRADAGCTRVIIRGGDAAMRLPGFADTSPPDVVRRAVRSFFADNMATYAAALSFHLLLALFPFVIVLLALLGAV